MELSHAQPPWRAAAAAWPTPCLAEARRHRLPPDAFGVLLCLDDAVGEHAAKKGRAEDKRPWYTPSSSVKHRRRNIDKRKRAEKERVANCDSDRTCFDTKFPFARWLQAPVGVS